MNVVDSSGWLEYYIGGGNAKSVQLDLPATAQIVSNQAGITGGIRLWDALPDRVAVEA